MNPRQLALALCALVFHPDPGHAKIAAGGGKVSIPRLSATPLPANPAPLGGVSRFGELGGAWSLPALPAAAMPVAAPGISAAAGSLESAQGRLGGLLADPAVAAEFGAFEQALALGGAIGPEELGFKGGEAAQWGLGRAFDGSAAGPRDASVDAGDGGDRGGGDGGGSEGGRNDDGNGGLSRLSPRVVIIVDTLEGPASDKLVGYIEKLADSGVRVVFVSARPEKGENSADSVLISKLKIRSGNPVVVASYNGSRIMARSSRAENPKPLVEDEKGFPEPTLARFRKIAETVRAKHRLRGRLSEFGYPDLENPYIYGAELPSRSADAESFVRDFNAALRSAGFPYKAELGRLPGGRKYFYTQSTALRLNTGRIFQAIYAQHPELRDNLKREETLVLADSRRAQSFLKSLSQQESVAGKGFYIHGVSDRATLETALGAVLGENALEKVSVLRSQLRSYTDWLDRRAKYGDGKTGKSRSGGYRVAPASHGRYYRDLGFFRGILIYDLMGRLYHLMRKGQYHLASPEAAEELLHKMWYNPRGMGVRTSDQLEASRNKGVWKALQKGYLETTKVWLRNYYKRNFKDYPTGVSENVVGQLINLARDSKNSITLSYLAPFTGRRYMVHLLPARAELEKDDKGELLVAHVYRSGKEPFESEFEDSVETNLLARAMLTGYGRQGADGIWRVNGSQLPVRVKVVFHYMTRDLSVIQTPEEVDSHTPAVTTLIEKMQTDKEFLDFWEEQEKKNGKVTPGAGKSKLKAKAKPAPKGK